MKRLVRDVCDPVVRLPRIDDLEKTAAERGWTFEQVYPKTIQSCPGARAMGEDFLAWVDNGKQMLKSHRDASRGQVFSRHWASLLHSVYRYPMDRVFRCAVPGASIVRHGGGVLSGEHEILSEAFFLSRLLRKSEVPQPWPRPLEGKFISLLTIWGDRNLGHFFFDAMLRTAAFDNLADYRFLVPEAHLPWHSGLYEVAGIRPDQLVPVRDGVVAVEELHVCHTSSSGSMPRKELLLKFRERARKAAGVNENTIPFRRLFVDRSGAKRRKLLNQNELEMVLSARGFDLIRWEEHSIKDQIRIASETAMMVGPHGTNLLNSIYCRPGAKLMEIINPMWWDAATLRQASLVGHEFWYCFGEDASPDHDTRISPDKLCRILDYMLEADVCEVPPEKSGREVTIL